MGGIGSGRKNQRGKATTDDFRAIDIRWMQREGMLAIGKSSSLEWLQSGIVAGSMLVRAYTNQFILSYTRKLPNGDISNESYPVRTESTLCHLGGERIWVVCPAQGCGKRVAKLYLGPAGIFACRHCYKLAYQCQRESSLVLADRRLNKVRLQLNPDGSLFSSVFTKPKGMHWRTFHRLREKHDSLLGLMYRSLIT